MLVVLYGTTGYVGKASRKYFQDKGFELVPKISYMPDTHMLNARYDKRNKSTLEDVKKCDFVYEYPDGTIIGFNKTQIIDAVWGHKNCLITFSTLTTEFIEHIKNAYGDFVTVIGVYIERECLENVYSLMEDITEEEIKLRINISKSIYYNLSNKRELFDDLAIFNGKDDSFNINALYCQYDSFLKKAFEKEKLYRDKNYVPLPYTGSDPYIFISYSHKDSDVIYPILSKLQLKRCRIWFDAGINGGQNWRKMIASKIESVDCKNFIIFVSKNSISSFDVIAEINAALDLRKEIIPIYLDDSRFPTDISMYLFEVHRLQYDDKLIDNILNSLNKNTIIS